MLQVNDGSNSIIDFVFGHFSSCFIFSSTSIVFFNAFFAAIFSWKIQHKFFFPFESSENFFWHCNIHHLDLANSLIGKFFLYLSFKIFRWDKFAYAVIKNILTSFCIHQFFKFIVNWREITVVSIVTIITKICIIH